ncbi:MAG: YcfA family protein [uncultured bacterium (gcode 4)]|uniref:YcfA family protein n=1 Tax=uncultured bacterium (gcode 4) TaxID=1234023 RepID=K1XZY6_9BACT|nr:MAG: YcfA family protein [uncultured bacterium (gcode 4)]
MWKIKPISHTNFVKKLKKLWFVWPFSWWKHLFMSRWDFDFTIPNKHGNQDIGIALLSRLLRQIEISIDEWNEI